MNSTAENTLPSPSKQIGTAAGRTAQDVDISLKLPLLTSSLFPARFDGPLPFPRFDCVSFESLVEALGRLWQDDLGVLAEIRLYQCWIGANSNTSPYLFAAWFNLGVALARQGDRQNAVAAYRNALFLKPGFHAAAVNLGLSLEALGQPEAALQSWDDVLQSDNARTALLNQKARLLEKLGRLEEAETALEASVATDGKQPDAIQHWMHIRQKMCLWPTIPTTLVGHERSDFLLNAGPLGILALTDDVCLQRDVATAWVSRKTNETERHLAPTSGYDHARLRIGYLSSDFCRHAMSYLIVELFERHDRTRFEVFGYCSSPEDGSDIRTRVLGAFDHIRIIRNLSDEQAAQLIRDDEIDILVDLNGLTSGARLQILRWKPAPVQATYLGYIGPVPIPELDYLFCDQFVIPPEHNTDYRPAPLYIGEIYQANDRKRTLGRTVARTDFGLPDEGFVLCCFSNHYKITFEMFSAWMTILREADGAVLWLARDNTRSEWNMSEEAKRQGIACERIIFSERTDPSQYMAQLRIANLFLDTFPYNAGTIASDAIRMQLPLVTLRGRSFASRMAARLLTAINAPEGVAENLREYISLAVRLARDPKEYLVYKARFTTDAWMSTIGNTKKFTSEFEATLGRIARTPDLTDQPPRLAMDDC